MNECEVPNRSFQWLISYTEMAQKQEAGILIFLVETLLYKSCVIWLFLSSLPFTQWVSVLQILHLNLPSSLLCVSHWTKQFLRPNSHELPTSQAPIGACLAVSGNPFFVMPLFCLLDFQSQFFLMPQLLKSYASSHNLPPIQPLKHRILIFPLLIMSLPKDYTPSPSQHSTALL